MRIALLLFVVASLVSSSGAQSQHRVDLTQPQDYVLKRASSYDRSGGNADYREIAAGATLNVLDVDGPGTLTHIWFTLSTEERMHLKKLVLRMYWDGEKTPSVETPLGDFFGLGLGEYYPWESEILSVANFHALNSWFVMPFQKHALITVTNEGSQKTDAFYFNLDYRAMGHALPADALYFHAQFRQAQPNHGTTTEWNNNGDPRVDQAKNIDGKDNYVWMDASGRGHFVGVTMSVLQNQDYWFGEGDDMFFIDGETARATVNGTGMEDYFNNAWMFQKEFNYPFIGYSQQGNRDWTGSHTMYRFHIGDPIYFQKSLRATIEHGHANDREDDYTSVAFWYQTEPHQKLLPLPPVNERLPNAFWKIQKLDKNLPN